MKTTNNLPSRHQINDIVDLEFYQSGKITNCQVEAIRFTKGKVKYDLSILLIKSTPDERKDAGRSTVIKNVDAMCVVESEEFSQKKAAFMADELKGFIYKDKFGKPIKAIQFDGTPEGANNVFDFFSDGIPYGNFIPNHTLKTGVISIRVDGKTNKDGAFEDEIAKRGDWITKSKDSEFYKVMTNNEFIQLNPNESV